MTACCDSALRTHSCTHKWGVTSRHLLHSLCKHRATSPFPVSPRVRVSSRLSDNTCWIFKGFADKFTAIKMRNMRPWWDHFLFFFTSFTACTHNIALPFPRRLAAVQFPNMVMEEREKKPERKKLISKEPFLLFPDTRYATGHQSNADNNITRQPCQDIYWRCLSCSPPRDGSK